jgi:hypothetical protein
MRVEPPRGDARDALAAASPAASAATPRQLVAIGMAAAALFLACWTALHHGFLARGQLVDTPVYQAYGDEIVQGRVPYRDFAVEYPPAALSVFVLPALGGGGHQDAGVYRRRFEWLMALAGLALLGSVVASLRFLGEPPGRALAVLGLVSVSPLALGSVVLTRFDLLPAAICGAALAALLRGRGRLALGLLGVGVGVKIYPLVLLPPALLWLRRRRGDREALAAAQVFLAVVLLLFLPFLLVAPGGLLHSIWVQLSRPLQLESLGSSLLIALYHLTGLGLAVTTSSGSQNVTGTGSSAVATLTSLLQVAVLLGIWTWFGRGEAQPARLLRACAASLVAFVVLGKVLSPQFPIWLVPLVPLVRGRRGLAASGLLLVALLLTQAWFPQHYWQLVAFGAGQSVLLLARNLTLVALLAVLLWPGGTPPWSERTARQERLTPLPRRGGLRPG